MISILLATYNGSKYIEKAIESVLIQTFKDFELLIGLNGCVDDTKAIVNKIKDERIKIFEYDEPNKPKTLNKLLKHCSFDWIAIQDDDDIWLSNKLEQQIQSIKNKNVDIIGTNIQYIDSKGNHTGAPFLDIESDVIIQKLKSGSNSIANSSSIIRKSLLDKIDGWDESVVGIEDYDLWLKSVKQNAIFRNLQDKLVLHRIHKDSKFNVHNYDIKGLLKKHGF